MGALAANIANAQTTPQIQSNKDTFVGSEAEGFKSDILPTPKCNTQVEAASLKTEIRRNPLPTFDGVSPWPGLLGLWVHKKAGIYLTVANDRTSKLAPNSKTQKIAVVVYDLCTKARIANGATVITRGQSTIRVKLENHSLTEGSRPYITLSRIEDEKADKPIKDIIGMTLEYRKTRSERSSELKKESILLRNVLNL